jgi:hypothetical protein
MRVGVYPRSLWTLDLPEGMSTLNHVYGMAWLAGSVILAMIYVKWAGAAVEMTNKIIAAVQRKADTAEAAAKGKGKAGRSGGAGRRQREQQRRR